MEVTETPQDTNEQGKPQVSPVEDKINQNCWMFLFRSHVMLVLEMMGVWQLLLLGTRFKNSDTLTKSNNFFTVHVTCYNILLLL